MADAICVPIKPEMLGVNDLPIGEILTNYVGQYALYSNSLCHVARAKTN